jgi:sn-glycerol 3-phosphate transport system ATP-binding protein
MRVELIELHNKLNTTFVYVTHDQVEAMSMADTIVLMNKGEIQQVASPELIFNDPDNLFTARFIGSPAMNITALGGEGIQMGFRPERVNISREKKGSGICLSGIIIAREMLGNETIYTVRDEEGNVYTLRQLVDEFRMNDRVFCFINREHLYFFDGEGKRIRKDNPRFEECLTLTERLV